MTIREQLFGRHKTDAEQGERGRKPVPTGRGGAGNVGVGIIKPYLTGRCTARTARTRLRIRGRRPR